MSNNYKEQFLDPRWQKKRLEVLERDEWACIDCFDSESTLHVHHTYYEKGNKVWEYPNDSLITLCASCHQHEEDQIKQYSELIIETLRRSKFRADDWRQLSFGISKCIFQMPGEIMAHAYSFAFSDPNTQDFILNAYLNRNKPND
jgi:hypothetical protein